MSSIQDFKKRVLDEAPRLGIEDRFRFSCNPGVPCFNDCCADINILLTPYDVLRLKRRLGITSSEFINKYTVVPFNKEVKQPVPVLRMSDDANKTCPFLSEKGCTVYEDRPWACRMYPVGMAAPLDERKQGERFFFLMQEDHCKGFEEQREYSIAQWLEEQGIGEYNEAGELFKPISLHPFFQTGDMSPAKMDMFFTASYDLDRFRRFVFGTTFLDKFVIDPEEIEAILTDDYELMKFGFRWLRFALGTEPTMVLNPVFDEMRRKEKEFFQKTPSRKGSSD